MPFRLVERYCFHTILLLRGPSGNDGVGLDQYGEPVEAATPSSLALRVRVEFDNDRIIDDTGEEVVCAARIFIPPTYIDPDTGAEITTCDVEQGCGWVAGPYLSDEMSCRFTTEGATYATHEQCVSENPGSGPVGPAGTHVDWFPPCGPDQISDCYYPNVDACLPAVFGRPKPKPQAKQGQCSTYVCDASQMIDSAGRISFPSGACKCVN